jgi:hypothetical protein
MFQSPIRAICAPGSSASQPRPVEADLHVLETHSGGDGHAVPLVDADVRHLVAERLEPLARELVLTRLGLLDGEHVDVRLPQPRLDAVDARTDRVDVPGRDAHRVNLATPRQARP